MMPRGRSRVVRQPTQGRRAKGVCRICGSRGALTDDHVPPKCVTTPTHLELVAWSDALQVPRPVGRQAFQSQDFRTICRSCNVDRLGAIYDPALQLFCTEVARYVRMTAQLGVVLPDVGDFTCEPGKVARALVGHLLAADPSGKRFDPPTQAPMIEAMRTYFLASDDPAPSCLQLFAWPFPFDHHVLARSVIVARVLEGAVGPILGDFLKFFPLAWWLTYDLNPEVVVAGTSFPLLPAGDRQSVRIRFRPTVFPEWPEKAREDEVMLMDFRRTSIATRQRRR